MLAPYSVDVWLIPLDALAPGAHEPRAHELSPYEQERLRRLGERSATARHRYLASHLAARDIVAGYLGCDPGELTHVRNAQHGRPGYIRGWCPAPSVSLSRSAGVALLAVRRPGATVGVDVERIRQGVDWSRVLGRPQLGNSAGFQAWTRLEASVKASGLGLSAASGKDLSSWPTVPLRLPHPFHDYAAAVATDLTCHTRAVIRLRHYTATAHGAPASR